MKCYFHTACDPLAVDARVSAIISFAIPDVGVVFRTRCFAERHECDYLALVSLLEFLESNSDIMQNQNIEVLGDSTVVVYQLNGKMPIFSNLLELYRRIERFRAKLRFNVSWTPASLNRAAMLLPDLPPVKKGVKFDFSFASRKPGQSLGGSQSPKPTRLW
jgi:hypothetical protein